MKTQWLLFIILFLCACVAQSPKSTRSVASKVTTATVTPATPANEAALYWYTTASAGSNLLIDQNIQTSFTLRGSSIHTFLSKDSNSSKIFCIVATYSTDNVKKQLRLRAVPVTATEILTGVQRKFLRVDPNYEAENDATCSGTVASYTDTNTASTTPVVFTPPKLSTTVNDIYSSTSIKLYRSLSSSINDNTLIPSSTLSLGTLYLRINPKSNSIDPNSCSNSACQAKGYDCCIEGQCAQDGKTKSGINEQSAEYKQALQDILSNPTAVLKYPNFFYICPNMPHTTPTPTPTPNSEATADTLLKMLINEYNCLQGYKENGNYETCSASGTAGTEAYYKNVKKDVWNRCGCTADPNGTGANSAEVLCPNYGLKLIKNISGTIIRVECDISSSAEATPFQSLNVSVPARSAPHRFFKATGGSAVDDITTLTSLSTEIFPEGTVFSYLDEANKTTPQSGTFNMNAIMGQFTVKLTGAFPAKVIDVQYDQTYNIFTTKGDFTPCPQCAKDSWFSSFTSAPTSSKGMGVQATGYTTSRDAYSNNSSLANYEDSIFGRACWVPPTMLPFSHQKGVTAAAQRQNRLATQAAFYMNGYKRDWYGFNYGALIGSFDGVRWFAIGTGRRVTATSSKLFLALNTPFADLNSNSNLNVAVNVDHPQNLSSTYDYDPAYSDIDPRQNQAGTCQAWHQCNTDTDCVTKLGWEYACADVSTYKTNWPTFDSSANEKLDSQVFTFNNILQGMMPSGSSKRCVYRGAGAPCKANYANLSTTEQKKLFTCAPNFYCAKVSADAFNNEIVRTPNLLGNYLYGQEANVLGRPLYYVGASNRLTDAIQSNIKKNASNYVSTVAEQEDFGICRPGKKIGGAGYTYYPHLQQHQAKDTAQRTDYISQISSCDSSKTGTDRVVSCPLIGADGNLVPTGTTGYYQLDTTTTGTVTGFTTDAEVLIGLRTQNACGYEQRYTKDGVNYTSPFSAIELKTIPNLSQILTPGVAKDACLRRPGAVCHTDLDCTPNKLHADQSEYYPNSYFGGTDAEKSYWQESLICGQAKEAPYLGSSDYATYDITQNRCCRAAGKDFTMYTQSDTKALTPSSSSDDITNLRTSRLPQDYPSTNGRYSRYSVVNVIDRTTLGTNGTPYAQAPKVATATTPKEFQWKTIADTGARTCCGGSWIRKFSDGGHDWQTSNRLTLNFENFACLNYNNELYNLTDFSKVYLTDKNYYKDYDKLCLSPDINACLQIPIAQVTDFEITYPQDVSTVTATMDSSQDPQKGPTAVNYSHEVPYLPYSFYPPASLAGGSTLSSEGPFNYFKDPLKYFGTAFYLPSYISSKQNITKVEIAYYGKDHANPRVVDITANVEDAANCVFGTVNPFTTNDAIFDKESWCIGTDASGYQTFYAKADRTTWGTHDTTSSDVGYYHAGIRIYFRPMNTQFYVWKDTGTANSVDRMGMTGANSLYYLTKLGRLELSGIPQIFYEPLYCNSNKEKMVDGIFNSAPTRDGFKGISFSYDKDVNSRDLRQIYDASPTTATDASINNIPRITFMDKLATGQIFSDNQFTCCLPLGSTTTSGTNCCSNFAKSTDSTGSVMKCGLPPRTDLNVYFNRFVSGEGVAASEPGGGLVDDDFIPETGEPKLRQATYDKISALGEAYCQNGKVRLGSAFGKFYAEPNQGYYTHPASDSDRYFSIVDSINDYDALSDSDNGYVPFNEGYRWNHHLYCE